MPRCTGTRRRSNEKMSTFRVQRAIFLNPEESRVVNMNVL